MSFVLSFENGIKEGSLTSFEMTRIVIPNECEESFPSIFILCGRVQLMKHFVVRKKFFQYSQNRHYKGSQRSAVSLGGTSSPFMESGRCGLLIVSFHGDGAPS